MFVGKIVFLSEVVDQCGGNTQAKYLHVNFMYQVMALIVFVFDSISSKLHNPESAPILAATLRSDGDRLDHMCVRLLI